MKDFSFPMTETKVPGLTQTYGLEDPKERRKYFDAKVGKEIVQIRNYLKDKTFIAFLMGKKNSGKGTYTKLFMDAVGAEHVAHVSVGDVVRNVHKEVMDESKRAELMEFLKKRYRGFLPLEKVFDVITGRDTKTLVPTEVILALVERQVSKLGHKAIFIDGFPRSLDQIPYSLYLRAIIEHNNDRDFFVFIDVPEKAIDERMRYRVVCPICQTPRNTKLLRTKNVGYDVKKKEFYLMCDNPSCNKVRMVPKEGDELGIEALRDRIEADDKVMRKLLELHNVPKVLLRNSLPKNVALDHVDTYELTPSYRYEWNAVAKHVKVIEEPWTFNDDEGNLSYSLLPPPVVVSLIKQVAQVLEEKSTIKPKK